jgi:hypothetical protein
MKKKIILIGIILILLIGGGIYFYVKGNNKVNLITHNLCLNDNEIADYKIEKNQNGNGLATIIIRSKDTNSEIFRFQIDDIISATHYHPLEIHKCGVYIIQEFNYNSQKIKQDAGYKEELWRYSYAGRGSSLFLLAEKPKEFISYYSPDFRVDSQERYVVLKKGYFGSSDYALIIKDFKTLKDVFTLPMTEIEKQKPELAQDIEFNDWTKDGRYFWANTHYGANTLGFIRIDSTDWSVKIIPAPKDVLGGDALNFENGYITIHPGNVWYGIAEITEQEKAKRRAQGIGTEFYVENLITGKRSLIDKTTEPLWYFKPQWISDTELQYEMPSGEKKVYNINK